MRLAGCLLLCFLTLPAAAVVFGGTNLGMFGYPEPDCRQPHKPFEIRDEWARQQFVSEVDRYIACVREYVDNADNDVKRVIEGRDQAIADANRYIQSL